MQIHDAVVRRKNLRCVDVLAVVGIVVCECVDAAAGIRVEVALSARIDFPYEDGTVGRGHEIVDERRSQHIFDAKRLRGRRHGGAEKRSKK